MKDLEIKELYKVLEDQWGDSENYINDLIKFSKGLQAELELYKDNQKHLIKQLEEKDKRINKAIEFIKGNAMYSEDEKICCDDLYTSDCDNLLEILKGSDKE